MTKLKGRSLKQLTKAQLIAIIELMDMLSGPADETCDEPGIAMSEAAIRELIDRKHPKFYGRVKLAVSRLRR